MSTKFLGRCKRKRNWAIVGGESGSGARPMKKEWVVSLKNQCWKAGVPFFFKQWGGVQKSQHGRQLDGGTYDQMPAIATLAEHYA